ncbi:hypothetical protein ACQQ2Q_00615 [Agrobacterium sp. ES01]|uniref:hypothetical protein n=1 Tax=Agrobacterium sp. ES01 TaxID=3420714 RepID=UPI003D09F6AA
MNKTLLAALVTVFSLAAAAPALAISRYNSPSLTCEQARDILRSEGAAILRYPSKNVAGLPLYDRYVKNSRYCDSNEYAEWSRIPTKDDPGCRVLACEPIPRERDRTFPLFVVPNNSL